MSTISLGISKMMSLVIIWAVLMEVYVIIGLSELFLW